MQAFAFHSLPRISSKCPCASAPTAPTPCLKPASRLCAAAAQQKSSAVAEKEDRKQSVSSLGNLTGLGDALGPIALSYGGDTRSSEELVSKSGVELGPIGLSFGDDGGRPRRQWDNMEEGSAEQPTSIHSMTTAEWRAKYERNGTIDLWVEEEFNAGSRLVGGRAVHKGGTYGILTGEGPSLGAATKHKIKITNHYADQVVEVEVPEDRYILWEAEDAGLQLPYACRMGCCTACAVRIKEGEMYQPEALGISLELRQQGYGLMCVGFPKSDLVLETVSEDEVYELQFGQSFATQALNPEAESIERDDFALSIANMDE